MAQRIDSNDDDEFEILEDLTAMDRRQASEVVGDDSLNATPAKKISSSVHTTTMPVQLVNTTALPIDKVKPTENGAEPVREKSGSFSQSPHVGSIRYGSAAMIPHTEGFDFKSIFQPKSSIPSSNQPKSELLDFLENEKSKQRTSISNDLRDLLEDNDRDRHHLVQVARQAQQDFIDAIRLD